jgi:hypothetical protein
MLTFYNCTLAQLLKELRDNLPTEYTDKYKLIVQSIIITLIKISNSAKFTIVFLRRE